MAYANQHPLHRRARSRKGLQVPILITPSDHFSLASGQTEDISVLGVKVKTQTTPRHFHEGDEINFMISEDFLDLQGQGRIIWISRKGDTLGVHFTQLGKEMKRSLDDFLCFLKPITNNND